MKKTSFSTEEALRAGWGATLQNIFYFATVFFAFILLSFALSFFSEGSRAVGILGNLLSLITSLMIGIGFVKTSLRISAGETPLYRDFIPENPRVFFNYLFGMLVYAGIVTVGLLLLIVPGIILGTRLRFFPFLVIEQGYNFYDAMKLSYSMTRELTLDIFLFLLLSALINIVGLLAFGVGLFVTIPMTVVALAVVYRSILPEELVSEASPDDSRDEFDEPIKDEEDAQPWTGAGDDEPKP